MHPTDPMDMPHIETWTLGERRWPVPIHTGKPIDIVSLKAGLFHDRDAAIVGKRRAVAHWRQENHLAQRANCPICDHPTRNAEIARVTVGG